MSGNSGGRSSYLKAVYTKKMFGVNFSEYQWAQTYSSAEHQAKTKNELVPQSVYPFRYGAGADAGA